jgi:hypothetical protein
MKNRTILVLLASAPLLTSPAFAGQRWGQGPTPDAGVCFYEYPDFRGRYFCARPGDDLPFVPNDMNDRIASMRVFGGAQVVVYSYNRFDGAQAWFDYSVPNLAWDGWDDRISSLRVGARPYRGRWGERLFENRPRDSEGPRERFRDDESFRDRPRDRDDVDRQGRTDAATADAIVRRAYQDVLHRDADSGGLQEYRDAILNKGWTEAQVRQSLMDSPEYRAAATMTREKAQAVVRAAYLAILKREPDPDSRSYVDRVLNDHWTQQDVERELRNSVEYRAKNQNR